MPLPGSGRTGSPCLATFSYSISVAERMQPARSRHTRKQSESSGPRRTRAGPPSFAAQAPKDGSQTRAEGRETDPRRRTRAGTTCLPLPQASLNLSFLILLGIRFASPPCGKIDTRRWSIAQPKFVATRTPVHHCVGMLTLAGFGTSFANET